MSAILNRETGAANGDVNPWRFAKCILLSGCSDVPTASSSSSPRLRTRDVRALGQQVTDLADPVVIGIVVVSGLIVGIAISLVIAVMAERRRFIERKEAMFADWDSVTDSEKEEVDEMYEDELSPDHRERHEAAYLGGEPCIYC